MTLTAWRASRLGLDGDLVHPATGRPEPAPQVISALLDHVRLALEASDDFPTVNDGIGGTVDLTVVPARPRRA